MSKKNNRPFKLGDRVRIRFSYPIENDDGEEVNLEGYVGIITRVFPKQNPTMNRYYVDDLNDVYSEGPSFYSDYLEHVKKPKLNLPSWF